MPAKSRENPLTKTGNFDAFFREKYLTKNTELAEKTARLKELNILLNMDQKDNALIDDAPDEDAPERPRSKGMER